ncbi:MAG: hypothetical protein B5M51_03965 [Anaerolinea sp. 4484_236]|nr:MAG: hypothetical protein B5M51_03965 [Anaerolinea sp. 4484_236]
MISVRNFLGLVIILSLLAVTPVQAQGTDSKFFDQTRHNVQGAFWAYYQSVADAEIILGYPITEEFLNKVGSLIYRSGAQLNINNPLACRTYPETGYSVCFAFLEFFDAHGGVGQFGFPISPFEYQDNMIVQYFQNGRFEWHPSNPNGQRVVMGDMGSAYFYMAGEDTARLQPASPLNAGIQPQVLTLNVRAFPWKAVTYSTDQQLIFVIAQDQTLQPVPNASGVVKVYWPTGTEEPLSILTDANGVATLSLPVVNQPYGGLVTVEVLISHGDLLGETTTSFRIWY